jgi:hypothetical protein
MSGDPSPCRRSKRRTEEDLRGQIHSRDNCQQLAFSRTAMVADPHDFGRTKTTWLFSVDCSSSSPWEVASQLQVYPQWFLHPWYPSRGVSYDSIGILLAVVDCVRFIPRLLCKPPRGHVSAIESLRMCGANDEGSGSVFSIVADRTSEGCFYHWSP